MGVNSRTRSTKRHQIYYVRNSALVEAGFLRGEDSSAFLSRFALAGTLKVPTHRNAEECSALCEETDDFKHSWLHLDFFWHPIYFDNIFHS